jgi:hypothetical protein
MYAFVHKFDPPGHRIGAGIKRSSAPYTLRRRAVLLRFSRFKLISRSSACDRWWTVGRIRRRAHLLDRISSTKPLDFPLRNVRSANWRLEIKAYEPPSFLEISGGTTAQLHRVMVDVEVGVRKKVLDLVDPWLQSSIFEDGRALGHDKPRSMMSRTWETRPRHRWEATKCLTSELASSVYVSMPPQGLPMTEWQNDRIQL